MTRRGIILGIAAAIVLVAAPAMAATTATWTAPPNGSVFPSGTVVNVTGQAAGVGSVGGAGLDLALVMDSSGSMGGSPALAQKDAAHALVDALPADTTSVTVIDFDSDAFVVRVLTPLNPDIAEVHSAINMIDASGGTNIPAGINVATDELTSARHTVGRSQMMVVISDGSTSGNVVTASAASIAAGVDAIHSVGIPGHNVATMKQIVQGPNGIWGDGDDYGIYTAGSLDQLVALFSGLGGNLVGLDHIDITMPDGTFVPNVPFDGLGNFQIPGYVIVPGPQTFTVTAYGDDQTQATALLTLNGDVGFIPEPLTMLGLFAGLTTLGGYLRKRRSA
jgi:Ca-activated chloride channel family protein